MTWSGTQTNSAMVGAGPFLVNHVTSMLPSVYHFVVLQESSDSLHDLGPKLLTLCCNHSSWSVLIGTYIAGYNVNYCTVFWCNMVMVGQQLD